MKSLSLYPHQQKIYDQNPTRIGLFLAMRCGKSPLAIRLADKNCPSCLIICPKHLIEQWQDYARIWAVVGANFKVIGREQFRIHHKDLDKYDGIIADEVHRHFANFKSKAHKALAWYIKQHKIDKIWLLSGTPYSNNSFSVYSLGILLGQKWSWWEWKIKYFYTVRMGQREVPVQKQGIEKDMARILNGIGITMRLEDITGKIDDQFVCEYFDLNAEQKKLIKESFDPLPIVRFTKEHQIESGSLKGTGYTEAMHLDCEKTTRIKELVEENDKICIVCRYNEQIRMYANMLNKDRTVFIINGENKDRNKTVKEIETCDKCVVIINSSCSDGYSLKSLSIMVFASMSFSFVDYAQICDRLKDIEKKEPNLYIHLITRGKSVDKGVWDSVQAKKDFHCEIFKK